MVSNIRHDKYFSSASVGHGSFSIIRPSLTISAPTMADAELMVLRTTLRAAFAVISLCSTLRATEHIAMKGAVQKTASQAESSDKDVNFRYTNATN